MELNVEMERNDNFIKWFVRHRTHLRRSIWIWFRQLGEKRLMIILALVVGILSGLLSVVLKNVLHFTSIKLQQIFPVDKVNILYLALPAIGLLLTILFVKLLVKDDIRHGVSKVLYAISRGGSKIKAHNTFSSIIASVFTIGFGGSVGAEAPIVYTGAAIGSNVGKSFKLSYKNLTLLIGCGAAGAISSIFKAPLAGIVFTLEVLMLDLTSASIVLLLISSVSAATVSYFLLGKEVVLSYSIIRPFALNVIPWYILLGIFTGIISLYFIRASMHIEKRLGNIQSRYMRWAVGGIILGILIFLFPSLYGEGYGALQSLLDGRTAAPFNNSFFFHFAQNPWLLLILLASLFLIKVVATAVTNGSGGVGGTFAPTLFFGGVAGFFVARLLNQFGLANLSESNFVLVGMAGTMAAVMHAPLTAIFLIAEITGGYALFVPLIIVATVSFLTILSFEPYSIYTKKLAKRGDLITHNKDKAVLTLLSLKRVLETDFVPVFPTETLGDLVRKISQCKRNLFPVITKKGEFLGVVYLDDIRTIMFDSSKYSMPISDIMTLAPEVLHYDEPMERVMHKFDQTGAWNLPVVDNGKYEGFVSKSKIFSIYRSMLEQFSDE